MEDSDIVLWIIVCLSVGYVVTVLVQRWTRRHEAHHGPFTDPGVSVEVDCRGCGRFNRVPSHRLCDRPKCGHCKHPLMPGKQLCIRRVSITTIKGSLRDELDAVWKDEDQFWKAVADHVMLDSKARAEAKNPDLRVVN